MVIYFYNSTGVVGIKHGGWLISEHPCTTTAEIVNVDETKAVGGTVATERDAGIEVRLACLFFLFFHVLIMFV